MSPYQDALIQTPSRESPAPVDTAARPPSTSPGRRSVKPGYSEMSPYQDALIPTPSRESPAPVDTAARPPSTSPGGSRDAQNCLKNVQHHHSQAHIQPRNSQAEAPLALPNQCISHGTASSSPFGLARDQDPLR